VTTPGGSNTYQEGDFGYMQGPDALPITIPAGDAGLLTSDPLDAAACE
jgi:hypothetical protein